MPFIPALGGGDRGRIRPTWSTNGVLDSQSYRETVSNTNKNERSLSLFLTISKV